MLPLYFLRNVNISCFQFLGSMWAVLLALPRVLINLSASPLAFCHNGVILWCLNPNCSANCLNSKLWNGGPLSVFSSSGIPNNEKILSNRGITDLADVFLPQGILNGHLSQPIGTLLLETDHKNQRKHKIRVHQVFLSSVVVRAVLLEY